MMVFIAFFPIIWKKGWENKYTVVSYKAVKIFCACGFCFVLILTIVISLFQVHMYKETVGAYESGNYEIVEGYVENFIAMPYEGHSDESFEINGVKFSYSDYSVQPGYNNTMSHGGVITGDGQHLKIGYIYYNNTYGNIIVYIEQLS